MSLSERERAAAAPAGQTPIRGLTAVMRGEIGPNSYVRLGVVCSVAVVLLGGIIWLTRLHEAIAILEHKNGTVESRLEKMDAKLDRLLERRP